MLPWTGCVLKTIIVRYVAMLLIPSWNTAMLVWSVSRAAFVGNATSRIVNIRIAWLVYLLSWKTGWMRRPEFVWKRFKRIGKETKVLGKRMASF